jgi:phosphonate transport system substrate-binding protein
MKMNYRCLGFIMSVFHRRGLLPLFVCTTLWFSNVSLCGVAAAQTGGKTDAKAIALGLISEINHSAIEEHFLDLVRYVGRRLSSGPEIAGKVVVGRTPFELVKLLEQRQVDFYLESVYPTYSINYVHGAGKMILRRWKSGMAEYQSLLFSKRDGGIKRLDELRGKTIVFEDPGSTSGYLMPKFFLQRNGFKLAEKKDFDANATAGQVSYIFAYRQEKLLDMVFTKQAAAGAISDDDHGKLSDDRKSDIAVLAQTERLPRHLVSVRADLPPQTVARLTDILIAMHDDPEGQKILKKTDRTTKFDRLPGGEEALRKRLLDSFFSPDRVK